MHWRSTAATKSKDKVFAIRNRFTSNLNFTSRQGQIPVASTWSTTQAVLYQAAKDAFGAAKCKMKVGFSKNTDVPALEKDGHLQHKLLPSRSVPEDWNGSELFSEEMRDAEIIICAKTKVNFTNNQRRRVISPPSLRTLKRGLPVGASCLSEVQFALRVSVFQVFIVYAPSCGTIRIEPGLSVVLSSAR